MSSLFKYETGQRLDNKKELWIMDGEIVTEEEGFNGIDRAIVEVRPLQRFIMNNTF